MKVGFLSLGCPKNLVDGEVMLGLAERAGHAITPDASDADVLVVNTCAFIDSAKQESIEAILEMAEHKKSGRCSRLVVTGCLAERYRDELLKDIPEIDVVLGTGQVPFITEALGETAPELRGSPSVAPLAFFRRAHDVGGNSGSRARPATGRSRSGSGRPAPTYLYDDETPRRLATPRHFAYVKVAEGCDYTCSFCIIPTLRGRFRSRSSESIVKEAQALAAQGVTELILVSQDTTFYGNDRQERGALARLLRTLNGIEGLVWIRLLYLYPTTITDDTLAAMAECEKVCRYVDLPLQHASAAVLERMRRPGNGATYARLLSRIRERVPGVALRTTFIVGYPGETEAEFRELSSFMRDMAFDHVGVFTYSHEEGTRAFEACDDVRPPVKERRRRMLMAQQEAIVLRAHLRRVGTRAAVLIDGPSPEHPLVLQGRLEGQAPDIDPVVYLTDCSAAELSPGQLVQAQIVEARGYDLVARPV